MSVDPRLVIRRVAAENKIPSHLIFTASSQPNISRVRHLCIKAVVEECTDMTIVAIADVFGLSPRTIGRVSNKRKINPIFDLPRKSWKESPEDIYRRMVGELSPGTRAALLSGRRTVPITKIRWSIVWEIIDLCPGVSESEITSIMGIDPKTVRHCLNMREERERDGWSALCKTKETKAA